MIKQFNYSKKRKNTKKKKNDSFIDFYILIFFMGLYFSYNYFFEYLKVGYDYRYLVFIRILPMLFGVIFIGFYKRKHFETTLKSKNTLFIKTFDILTDLLVVIFFAFFILNFGTKIMWNYFNFREAKQNKIESFDCDIIKTSIGVGRSSKPEIIFLFNGRKETLPINYEEYGKYLKLNHNNLKIRLFVRKGIWNYYIVENKTIIDTANTVYLQVSKLLLTSDCKLQTSNF